MDDSGTFTPQWTPAEWPDGDSHTLKGEYVRTGAAVRFHFWAEPVAEPIRTTAYVARPFGEIDGPPR